METLDFFSRANADYIDRLHAQHLRDPRSLDQQWQAFFAGFEAGSGLAEQPGMISPAPRPEEFNEQPLDRLAEGAYDLVHSYRELGHCVAKIDPLGNDRPPHPLLALSECGLSEEDLSRPIGAGSFLGPPAATLGDLLAQLQTTYCGAIGVEY